MLNILLNGIQYSFTGFYLVKFGLHFYLDLVHEDYDIVEVFKSKNIQALHYYKRQESGRRGMLKRVCNMCFSISIVLFALWAIIGIAQQVA